MDSEQPGRPGVYAAHHATMEYGQEHALAQIHHLLTGENSVRETVQMLVSATCAHVQVFIFDNSVLIAFLTNMVEIIIYFPFYHCQPLISS